MFQQNQQRTINSGAFSPMAGRPGYGLKHTEKNFTHSQYTQKSTSGQEAVRSVTIMSSHKFKNTAKASFKTALLLVQDETNAVIDRRALREAGISNIRVLTSGVMAARLLVGLLPDDGLPIPEIVLCHKELADMSSESFIALIRLHPTLIFMPVLFVAGSDTEFEKPKILSSGFNGILTRPYSQDDLRQTLHSVSQDEADLQLLRRARKNLNTGKFDNALSAYEPLNARLDPEEIFKLAMQSLKEREWDKAIQAFNRSMKMSELKGESELGLATAWRGKGDTRQYMGYLQQAGHTFTMASKWHKARAIYSRLLTEEPTSANPFLTATERLVREGRYGEAAEAFAAGYDLSPEAEAQKCLVKSCCYATNQEAALNALSTGLSKTSAAHLTSVVRDGVESYNEEYEKRVQKRRNETGSVAPSSSAVSARTSIDLDDDDSDDIMLTKEEKELMAKEEKKGAIMPLDDLQPGLLSRIPVIGDALSVAKMTWKLYNFSKK